MPYARRYRKAKLTLGQILSKEKSLPKPVDEAVEKLWGYASKTARHGREGQTPSLKEAKLVVGVAAAVATFVVMAMKAESSI